MNTDQIADLVKCPQCHAVPAGKIFLCENGHPICEGCFAKLKEDPDHEVFDNYLSVMGGCNFCDSEARRSKAKKSENCDECRCPFVAGGEFVVKCRCVTGAHKMCKSCTVKIVRKSRPLQMRRCLQGKYCPQGKCGYATTPVRSLVVEAIIGQLKLDCEYKANGCNVQKRRCDLISHEVGCKYRLETCPLCDEKLVFCQIYDHLTQKYDEVPSNGVSGSGEKLKHKDLLRAFQHDGRIFCVALTKKDGLTHVLAWVFDTGDNPVDKLMFECKVSLDNGRFLTYAGPPLTISTSMKEAVDEMMGMCFPAKLANSDLPMEFEFEGKNFPGQKFSHFMGDKPN